MRTLPPSRLKDINAADAVVMKVREDCTRVSPLLFNLREKRRRVFRTPRCINQSNSSPSRTMRPLDG